jgi:hypothetical protein
MENMVLLCDLGNRLKLTETPIRRMIAKAHKFNPKRFKIKRITVEGTNYKRAAIDSEDAHDLQSIHAWKHFTL